MNNTLSREKKLIPHGKRTYRKPDENLLNIKNNTVKTEVIMAIEDKMLSTKSRVSGNDIVFPYIKTFYQMLYETLAGSALIAWITLDMRIFSSFIRSI